MNNRFVIRVAGVALGIESSYDYLPLLCQGYRTDAEPEGWFSASADEIAAMHALQLEPCSDGYCESICVFAKVCDFLWSRDICMMHAAAIEMDGCAYLFTAPSGTGKSTHILQWRKRYGERVHIINGDKPFLQQRDGRLWVCGSPWCGKEGWSANISAPLGAVCFVTRAETNTIRRLHTRETMRKLFLQVAAPENPADPDTFFRMMDLLVREVPCYELGCTISEQAAEVAYRGMKEENT